MRDLSPSAPLGSNAKSHNQIHLQLNHILNILCGYKKEFGELNLFCFQHPHKDFMIHYLMDIVDFVPIGFLQNLIHCFQNLFLFSLSNLGT